MGMTEGLKNEHNYEPVVLCCGIDKDIKPGTRCGPVRRDIFLIESCKKGYGTIIINGREFPITPRSCYFLFPGDIVTHVTDDKEPREGYYCAVEGEAIGRVLHRMGISSESPFARAESFDEIYSHLETLYLTRDEADPGADMRRMAHVYAILSELLRFGDGKDKNRWVQKAIGYMEMNYHTDISVSALANEVGLERTYFSTMFKEQTGVSPHAYLTRLRVKKAISLITSGAFSMGEIATAVGLDPQNFARIFQRETGKSPKEYQNKKKSADAEPKPGGHYAADDNGMCPI